MKRISYLLPAAIALVVLGGCVIVSDKKPADSAPPPPPPTATATTAPTATATSDAGAAADAAPTATSTATRPGLKKPPSRDAGTK